MDGPGDRPRLDRYALREADWRVGAVVYQVLVDRFAPSANLAAKRHLYPAPKVLRAWDEVPCHGRYLDDAGLWSHEIEFWGGDLASVAAKLDHVVALGADVLYLNPIHDAYTNHKYDALDYARVSPEFGTRDDVKALAAALHARGLKLVLDGVFNHMGRHAPRFVQAQAAGADDAARGWFVFDEALDGGARCWRDARNLPELNLENPAVRDHLWQADDSVVRGWLRDGVDGWRLDVAFDLGHGLLRALTRAAHATRPGSLVVGEIANYPATWLRPEGDAPVDALMNFTLRQMLLRMAQGRLGARHAMAMLERMVADTGLEPLLRSWIYLDNHDTPRLVHELPEAAPRRMAQVLQFTLPGAPNLYYGSELDMPGGGDPEMRAPMRWDLVRDDLPALAWTKRLIALRRRHRALRVGDWRTVVADRLFAFERFTDRVADTVVVLANPTRETVHETVLVANASLMDSQRLLDALPLEGDAAALNDGTRLHAGLLDVTVPAQSARVLVPETAAGAGYSAYKRVR